MELRFTVELGEAYKDPTEYQARWARIVLNGHTIMSECVYDSEVRSATDNIISIFAHRLEKLLATD